mmetsp:Transcript_3588/g.7550  ORF Transcript_3588/g.7550 Transcript_3588/m.7550 type:complete len:292 (-) Transcript_3588:104-979(-)
MVSGSSAAERFFSSSIAAVFAETLTLPIDVAKTRLQTQSQNGTKYCGMTDAIAQTYKAEGAQALWKGLRPALIRQVCYSSLSFVLYPPILDGVTGGRTTGEAATSPSYLERLIAGGTAGALAITVFNPTEILKTQIQNAPEEIGMSYVIRRVIKRDGLLGLWAGLGPNITRTFLVNAAELGTYDHAKNALVPLVGEGLLAYVGASGIAALVSASVSTPADVIKTRLMQQAGGTGGWQPAYSGVFDAVQRTIRQEGLGTLYSGFTPILCRKVLWCTAFFVLYERVLSFLAAA